MLRCACFLLNFCVRTYLLAFSVLTRLCDNQDGESRLRAALASVPRDCLLLRASTETPTAQAHARTLTASGNMPNASPEQQEQVCYLVSVARVHVRVNSCQLLACACVMRTRTHVLTLALFVFVLLTPSGGQKLGERLASCCGVLCLGDTCHCIVQRVCNRRRYVSSPG